MESTDLEMKVQLANLDLRKISHSFTHTRKNGYKGVAAFNGGQNGYTLGNECFIWDWPKAKTELAYISCRIHIPQNELTLTLHIVRL